jgi:hypothetical protein
MAERRIGDEALLPLRLFRNGVFSVTSAAGLIIGTGMFGGLVLVPQYLQIVKGISPTEAGLRLLWLMGGIMAASWGLKADLPHRSVQDPPRVWHGIDDRGAAALPPFDCRHPAVGSRDLYGTVRASGWAVACRRSSCRHRMQCRLGIWGWPPRRRRSSGKWVAPWVSRCSCRFCSPLLVAGLPTHSAPSPSPRNSSPRSPIPPSAATPPTPLCCRRSVPVAPVG